MVKSFLFSRTPKILFGVGKIAELAGIAKTYGNDVLLITGARSFSSSKHGEFVLHTFDMTGIHYHHVIIPGEPSPEMIDQAVIRYNNANIKLVIAIGGGSVMDAGKAISAMLGRTDSVQDYLEGVGKKEHPGTKVPFIAVPTTAGTGTEATKNAVISRVGSMGFKRSLRHDNFMPDIAIVDPEITMQTPPNITAASGMDCFTQLVESYVSDKSTPFTDALALDALAVLKNALPRAWKWGQDLESRTGMSYAALVSGICLANANLGAVHGFASSIGGMFTVPHGVVCGTLMASANSMNVIRLREQPVTPVALNKYAILGRLFSGEELKDSNYQIDYFLQTLTDWTEMLNISKLGKYGIKEADVERIVDKTDIKSNPVKLSRNDLKEILEVRI